MPVRGLPHQIAPALIGRKTEVAAQAVQQGDEDSPQRQVVPFQIQGSSEEEDPSFVPPPLDQGGTAVVEENQGFEIRLREDLE